MMSNLLVPTPGKLPPDRAKTLKEAYRACNVGPLKGESLRRYYVDLSSVRSMEAMESLNTQLEFLEPGEFDAVLFTGHRGCGKSTELRKLQESWSQDYRVIYLESDHELDLNDAEYTDLYLVMIKQIVDDMAVLRLQFEPALIHNFQRWFLEITDETEESVEKSFSLATQAEAGYEIPFISKLMAKLLAQIKGATTFKRTIRDSLQRDVGRLQRDMNLLLRDGFNKLTKHFQTQGCYQKGFLLIFDNLDRMPPEVGDRLYFDSAIQMQEVCCTVIYTVPISVIYSVKNLNNAFGRANIMPMVNIYNYEAQNPNLKFNADALKRVMGLITSRIDVKTLFENPKLVLRLAQASGGHVRQLMQMSATAALTAATRKHAQIEADDVEYAINQEQFNFERLIPFAHYASLVQVCHTKRVDDVVEGQRMLFNTSVLEYNGKTHWNYVNPLVKRTPGFQDAWKSRQSS